MSQVAEAVRDQITYEQDGAWTKIWLPKSLQVEHDIFSPYDHREVWFRATIIGWAYENGLVRHAYYRRGDHGDVRFASFFAEVGRMPYFVENPD